MPGPNSETIELARSIREDLAVHFPPRFAKLYSQHTRLSEGQAGLTGWRQSEASERLEDAMRLLEAAFIEREAGNGAWTSGLRRVGELLEWLSHSQLNPDRLPLRFLAAAAYQLAGYPARASGLLIEDSVEDEESNIIRFLLKADFPKLFRSINGYWATRTSSSTQREKDLTRDDVEEFPNNLARLVVEETVKVLSILCTEMRWGGEHRVERALDKFSAIGKVFLHGDDPYSWLLARLCAEAASVYIKSSLRYYLNKISEGMSPAGKDALERYFRQSYQLCRILAWPSQVRGIERLSSGESFALCTPTGSGKTTVAELAILQSLFPESSPPSEPKSHSDPLEYLAQFFDEETSSSIVVYLVPSRALATEVESKLSSVLCRCDEGIIVTGLYGGTDWGPTDAWLTREDRIVLICTYEKAEALIRFLGTRFLSRASLVVIDEAHSVQFDGDENSLRVAENRSLRLESLVTRLHGHLDLGRSRIIALSAVASGCADEIARWVAGNDDACAVKTSYRSTRQLIGRLECLPNRRFEIFYDLLDGDGLSFEETGQFDRPYVPNPFPTYPSVPIWEADSTGPEKRLRPYLFWAAIHLAKPDEKGQQHSVLISITQGIGGYAEDFLELLDSNWGKEAPEFFRPPIDPAQAELWDMCKRSCADYFGRRSREYRLLEKGVIVHHGKMPGLTARLLVKVIKQQIVHLVIATSTLSEGVNLPFGTILIPSLRRWTGYINAREFGNLVGRAGRPGFGTEGRSLVLLQPVARPNHRRSVEKARSEYFSLIKELSDQSRIPGENAVARSPLAELIVHLARQWKRLSVSSSGQDFLEWLEQTAPLEIEGDNLEDKDLALIETLDSLDSVLLSAIVEIEKVVEEELSLDDLEERLKQIWQRSYAHYASENEAALGKIFARRGRALKSAIYPESSRRRRLYCTSLPPRSGDQLLSCYTDIRQHLEDGREYANWDCSEKFDYIRLAVKQIGTLPKFRLSEKAGRSIVNWQEVLRWWLDPDHAIKKPTPKQVSNWHNYVSQNFGYRFNWGLGSIIALAIDEVHDDGLYMPNVEDWPQTGLPWIVFWLKELIVWGTLDPVAAYLLTRGIEFTRGDAERTAQLYYEEQPEDGSANELLNAMTIRKWTDALSDRDHEVSSVSKPPSEIEVSLLRDFTNVPEQEWRVVPVEVNGEIQWFDPAGFSLAACRKPEDWQTGYLSDYDFTLDAFERIVRSKAYI